MASKTAMCTMAIARLRAAGAELLAEHAGLARRHRRVIEAAGIDRDLVPVTHALQGAGAGPPPTQPQVAQVQPRAEARPERVFESPTEPLRAGAAHGDTRREHPEQKFPTTFHHFSVACESLHRPGVARAREQMACQMRVVDQSRES